MRLSKSTFVALILIMSLVAVVFAGCSNEGVSTGTETAETTLEKPIVEKAEEDPDVEIVWWQYPRWGNLEEGKEVGDMEDEIIADFISQNANAKVKIEHLAWEGGPEKVNVAIAANNMPDLLFDYPGRQLAYGRSGVLLALDDIFTDELRNDIPDAILSQMKLDGKIVLYPVGAVPVACAVNVDIFEENGILDLLPLDREDRTWTFEEFETALKTVKEKVPDVYPSFLYAMNYYGDSSIRMFIQSAFGADLINEDYTEIIFNSENGIKGLEWILQAYKDGLFAPGAESANSTNNLETFYQGQVAVSLMSAPSHIGTHQRWLNEGKAIEMNWKFVPYPNVEGKDPQVEVQVYTFCAFDNNDELRAKYAKKFLDFALNGKYKDEAVKATGALPVRESMAGKLYDDPEYIFAERLVKFSADTGYTAPNYNELRSEWYPMLQGVLIGELTPEEGMNMFAEKGTEIINKE